MDIVLIKPFPLWYWPMIIIKTLFKKLHTSKYIETIRCATLSLEGASPFPVHIDGDYFGEARKVSLSIQPGSLHMIVGKSKV